MSKIIIFGAVDVSPLYVSVDGGKELTISGKYARSISVIPGVHYIAATSESKLSRRTRNTGNDFLSSANNAMAEGMNDYLSGQVDLAADDVLLIQVKVAVVKTKVYAQIVKSDDVSNYVYGKILDWSERAPGEKNKWIVLLLCLFFGVFGVHRFYEKKIVTGILYLLTLGIGGIGVLYDLVKIFSRPS